jgi:hypothetical protein
LRLIPKNRRFCKDCAYFKGELTAQDSLLLAKMLERYGPKLILESWVKLRQLGIKGGKRLDVDKVRVTEIVAKEVLCPVEKAFITPVDVACYGWKPRK